MCLHIFLPLSTVSPSRLNRVMQAKRVVAFVTAEKARARGGKVKGVGVICQILCSFIIVEKARTFFGV